MPTEQENIRALKVKRFTDLLSASDYNAESLLDAAMALELDDFEAELTKAMAKVTLHYQKLVDDPATAATSLDFWVKLLGSLAEVLPALKQQLRDSNLYLAQANEIAANVYKTNDLKRVVAAFLSAANLRLIAEDLRNELAAAKKHALAYTLQQLDRTRKSLTHHHTAHALLNDFGASTIEVGMRNILYDPPRRFGGLLAALWFVHGGAALNMESNPEGAVPHTELMPKESYGKMQTDITGRPVMG